MIDWLIAGTASAVICWPVAFHILSGKVTDTAQAAGLDFMRGQTVDPAATVSASAQSVQAVLAATLIAQVAMVFIYEWLCLTITSTTPGKALLGVRVRVDGDVVVSRRWTLDRMSRFAKRTALAVLPGGLITVALPLGLAGVTAAWIALSALLVVSVMDLVPAVGGGRTAHDRWAGTQAIRIAWARAAKSVQATAATTRDVAAARSQGVREAAQQARDSDAARRAVAGGVVAVRRGQSAVGRIKESRVAGEATQQGRQVLGSALTKAAQLRASVQPPPQAAPNGSVFGAANQAGATPPTATPPGPQAEGGSNPAAPQ